MAMPMIPMIRHISYGFLCVIRLHVDTSVAVRAIKSLSELVNALEGDSLRLSLDVSRCWIRPFSLRDVPLTGDFPMRSRG